MKTKKAGAIIVRSGIEESEILLIFQGNQKSWSFPKGHCEPGESPEQTAIREVKEETGLDIRILKRLPDMEYQTPDGEEIELALFYGTPMDLQQQERIEYEWDELAWIPSSLVEEKLSYQNLKTYLREHVRELKKIPIS
jgi:8-oxo-dGTP pyrophosphatase MutT (NUDIX family)